MLRRALIVVSGVAALAVACGSAEELPGSTPEPTTETTTTDPAPPAPGAVPFDPASCDGPAALEKMDPATLPPCCDGTAHCVPKAKVPGIVRKALSECTGGYCVPDAFLLSGGKQPPMCTAFNGKEGTCISTCVPEVAKNKDLLQQGTCVGSELCAPCIHPLTNESTYVCDIGKGAPAPKPGECADAGGPAAEGGSTGGGCPHVGAPVFDPSKLPACGGVAGSHCLDAKLVPPAMASKLAACATGLCVPDDFIAAGGNFIPKTCVSLGGIEGRCLHPVLPDVASQATILPTSTCTGSDLCTPCWHPSDGADTGACKLSCDPGPKQPPPACPHTGPNVFDPAKFPACAAGAHCLPAALLSPAAAADLSTCPSGGRCVPDVFIKSAGRFVPPSCNAIGGAEGRCLARAIPKIGAQTSLTQSTCASFERCAPCFNPLDGTDTGACRQSCDPGPTKPAYVFPYCCGLAGYYRGRCVPTPAIPDAEEANLSRDVCSRPGDLCVPSENLATPFNPPACSAFSLAYFGSYQGVCLSNCLQFAGLQNLIIKQGSCDGIHQCVPCYKPGGAPTGAPGCN